MTINGTFTSKVSLLRGDGPGALSDKCGKYVAFCLWALLLLQTFSQGPMVDSKYNDKQFVDFFLQGQNLFPLVIALRLKAVILNPAQMGGPKPCLGWRWGC